MADPALARPALDARQRRRRPGVRRDRRPRDDRARRAPCARDRREPQHRRARPTRRRPAGGGSGRCAAEHRHARRLRSLSRVRLGLRGATPLPQRHDRDAPFRAHAPGSLVRRRDGGRRRAEATSTLHRRTRGRRLSPVIRGFPGRPWRPASPTPPRRIRTRRVRRSRFSSVTSTTPVSTRSTANTVTPAPTARPRRGFPRWRSAWGATPSSPRPTMSSRGFAR